MFIGLGPAVGRAAAVDNALKKVKSQTTARRRSAEGKAREGHYIFSVEAEGGHYVYSVLRVGEEWTAVGEKVTKGG